MKHNGQKVGEWVAQGLKLSDIQNRLVSELGVTMTYMEVRFLVDDLKLTLKDPEPTGPIEVPVIGRAAARRRAPQGGTSRRPGPPAGPPLAQPQGVSISVDKLHGPAPSSAARSPSATATPPPGKLTKRANWA